MARLGVVICQILELEFSHLLTVDEKTIMPNNANVPEPCSSMPVFQGISTPCSLEIYLKN